MAAESKDFLIQSALLSLEILSLVPKSEKDTAVPYQDWIARLRDIEGVAFARGLRVVRIEVKPAAVKEWCKARNLRVCAENISDYAAYLLAIQLNTDERN